MQHSNLSTIYQKNRYNLLIIVRKLKNKSKYIIQQNGKTIVSF